MSVLVKLLDNQRHDEMAAEWLRKHRHGVDTSEAYDDLRALLGKATEDLLSDASNAWTEHLAVCEEQAGYEKGVASERDRIVLWLLQTGRYDNPWNLSDVADAIRRGDHKGVPAA